MPTQSNITAAEELFSGTDKVLQYTVTDSAGAVQIITGWALRWALYAIGDRTTALITKTVGAGITITNGAGGILQVAISDDDTNSLTANARTPLYDYELRRTDSGNEDVLAYGTVVLRPGKVTT